MSSPVAIAFVAVVLVAGALLAYAIFQWGQQRALSRGTRAELASSEEYRRLSELAIAAQQQTDLKLGEIVTEIAHLRDQLDQIQKVLKDVE